MSNQEHTQHKSRPKLITLLLSMLLVLSMLVPTAIAPLEVYADYDGTQGDNTGYDKGNIGASQYNTGILLYIADAATGEPVTGSVVVSQSRDFNVSHNFRSKLINGHTVNLSSQGLTFLKDSSVPFPLTSAGGSWNPNGDAVKTHLLKQNAAGTRVYEYYLQTAFAGQSSVWDEIHANPSAYNIVVHAICKLHIDGKTEKAYTTDGAVQEYGSGQHTFIHGGMYNCMITQEAHWGVMPPSNSSGIHSEGLDILQSTGWGIHVIDLDPTVGKQTTADEPKIPTVHEPPDESKGNKIIVKNYRTYNETTGVYTDDGKTHRNNVAADITIEEEGEYVVKGWKTSTGTPNYSIDSTKWEKTQTPKEIQSGPTSGSVKLGDTEKVLYVLLEKPENLPNTSLGKADFIMSQSTITRKIKLSYPDNTGLKLIKDHTFKWTRPAHKFTCEHTHTWKSGTDSEGNDKHDSHTVSCTWGKFTDNHTKLSLKNSKKSDYPDIVATKAGWENVTTTGLSAYIKRYQEHNSGHLRTEDYWNHSDWDYSCVLLRGKDKLTVASWKNTDLGTEAANTDLAGVSDSGFSIGNSTSQNRKKVTYFENFKTYFEDDSPDLNTTYSTTAGVSCHGGNNCGENTRTFSLSNPLAIDVGVLVETYSGTEANGTNDASCNSTPTEYGVFSGLPALSGLTSVRGIEVQSGGTISFRPYIQMNYDVQTATHEPYSNSTQAHKTAYVLGDIQRSMTPNDYAEVSWKERNSDSPNLTLNSLQWSTHSSAVDFISTKLGAGNLSKFTVLPGGATLDLTIKDSDRQKLAVTTYQCVIEGSGKTQIDNAGGSDGGLTPTAAETSHKAYVDSVKNALDKLNVEQWIVNDISSVNGGNITSSSKQVWNMHGEAIHPGQNLELAGHPLQDASTEEKYYLRDDGTLPNAPAGEGDLDVEEKGTTTKKYTFFTNTKGEIRYTVDDVNPNIGNEDKGNLANDSIANQINQRTHVVDKLQAAVEQGTGVDKTGRSKTGTNWYNEAFDGITVYVQTTELSLGYIDPPARSTVLDVKLTQTQDNQQDMFNKDKYNMSQYKTKPFSNAYEGDADRVGEFKGTSVYMKDMSMLFFSRQFFIPNATVDDLH